MMASELLHASQRLANGQSFREMGSGLCPRDGRLLVVFIKTVDMSTTVTPWKPVIRRDAWWNPIQNRRGQCVMWKNVEKMKGRFSVVSRENSHRRQLGLHHGLRRFIDFHEVTAVPDNPLVLILKITKNLTFI